VDDGLATGSTMRAAVAALRRQGPARIVVAVPVGSPETCTELATEADAVVCVHMPEEFYAVGLWYSDFSQTTDAEVRDLLGRATTRNGGPTMAFELTSTGFHQGEAIPARYTADGDNVSPPLKWTDPPAGTRSLALICDDPDAPRGTFTHWVIFNIPAESREMGEGVPTTATLPNGTLQGKNGFGRVGYGGPSPPAGKPHRYVFTLYALSLPLDLPAGATKEDVLAALGGQVLGEAQLTGTYARQK
jgi:Raf kinase inhibitor-like YbhB/YbcL family protein